MMKKILVVDDEESHIRLYEDQLQRDGFTVVLARTNTEGLAFAISGHPDAIVLHMKAFTQDEMEMISWLRWDTWGKYAPIMLITSLDMDSAMMKKLLEYQPLYFLLKDVSDPKHVSQKIKEVLQI